MEASLGNLKVLDFTTLLPGPYATMMLADMGADVLKVSSPSKADLVLDSDPKIEGRSANLMWLNRNKKTMGLNLKTQEGIEIVKKLIETYDIVVEQFRPGVMEKLGLGYETLREINPKIIYCSITGYGQTGSMKDKAGHDINFVARSGLMSHSGRKETGPVLYNTQLGDLASGSMNSVISILAAVNYRTVTGKGQYLDISMMDGLLPFNSLDGCGFLAGGTEPAREEGMLNGGICYDYYKTKDSRYLSVGSLEPKFWKEFCEHIGRPDFIDKTMYMIGVEDGKEQIRDIILSKTLKEWMEIFKNTDCCVEPVLSLKEVVEETHVVERELIVEVEGVKQFACPIKFSESKPEYRHVGKEIGADTKEMVLRLGYDEKEFEEMELKGVFR